MYAITAQEHTVKFSSRIELFIFLKFDILNGFSRKFTKVRGMRCLSGSASQSQSRLENNVLVFLKKKGSFSLIDGMDSIVTVGSPQPHLTVRFNAYNKRTSQH